MLVLLSLLAGAAPPPIAVGPDTALRAAAVEAPIARVTVFEDRARVTRRASLTVPAGASVWRLSDLPSSAEGLRATVRGAELLRLDAKPAEREALPVAPAMELLERIDAAADALRHLDVERALVARRAQLFAELTPAPAVPEAQRDGRPAPGIFAEVWAKATAQLAAERERQRARLLELDGLRLERVRALDALRAELRRMGEEGVERSVISAAVVLNSERGGAATVELEYFVPGARWRPAYTLRFLPDQGKAELSSFGLVTQTSGEDWRDVELALSTALPSLGIELPKLQTWTLGEAKEWRPIVLPREPPQLGPTYPAPVPKVTRGEEERELDRWLVERRMGELERGRDEGASAREDKRLRAPASAPPPPPPPPMPMEPMSLEALSRNAPAMKAEAADMESSVSIASAAPGGAMISRGLALFEAPLAGRPPLDPSAPAALAGGLDHVYVVPARATVLQSGEAVRAPLGSELHPVSVYYEATPALAPEAYLRGTVTSRAARPILAGPVSIFMGSRFSGDGQLDTTGPGGTLALPLGADEDVRVSRKLISSTEKTGLLSKSEITTYRVELEVASFKTRAVKVALAEPLPKSGNEDIEIELVSAKPKAKGPDADGILRWEIEAQPGKVQKIELVYRVERPADWRLYQR